MTTIEKKMLLGTAVMLLLIIGSCVGISNLLEDEFGSCKGLDGAVNRVWSGEKCSPVPDQ